MEAQKYSVLKWHPDLSESEAGGEESEGSGEEVPTRQVRLFREVLGGKVITVSRNKDGVESRVGNGRKY